MFTKLRLSDPRAVGSLELDTDQAAVAAKVLEFSRTDAPAVVLTGAPGAGRTRVLLHLAAQLGEGALVLAPDRARADGLAEHLQHTATAQARPALSPSGFAYQILTTLAARGWGEAPQLLTGAEEDVIVQAALKAAHSRGDWPENLDEAVFGFEATTRQVRAAVADAYQEAISAADLRRLAQETNNAYWPLIAAVMEAIDEQPKLPVAALMRSARERLAAYLESGKDATEWLAKVLLIDDAQDLGPGVIALLQVVQSAGVKIVATFNPDITTEEYRGADPHLVGQWLSQGQVFDLGPSRRLSPAQVEAATRLREYCRELRESDGKLTAWETRSGADAPIVISSFGDPSSLEDHCLDQIYRWHLIDGVPFSKMAILTREIGTASRLAALAVDHGISVARRSSVVKFAENPLTNAILQLIGEQMDRTQMLSLIYASPLVDLPPRVVRELTRPQLAPLDAKSGEPVEPTPVWLDGFGLEIPGVKRELERAEAIAEAAAGCSDNLLESLWKIWEATDLAEQWRHRAMNGSGYHDDLLDALTALFRHADVYVQRNPNKTAGEYAREQLASRVPSDTISRGAPTNSGINIGTVAQFAGRSFERVIILGLQRGQWPNPLVRDGIFAISRAKAEIDPSGSGYATLGAHYRDAYRQTLLGEVHWLINALTRSSGETFVPYVKAADTVASYLVVMLQEVLGEVKPLQKPDQLLARPELTAGGMRQLVAHLRGLLIDPQAAARQSGGEEIAGIEPIVQAEAARILAFLAKSGASGADPRYWTGLYQRKFDAQELKTSQGRPFSSPAYVSPSSVERMITCPARWAAEQLGAQRQATESMKIGTFVHSLAEKYAHTDLGEQELLECLTAEAESFLGQAPTLLERQRHRKVQVMVTKLAQYLAKDAKPAIGVEVKFGRRYENQQGQIYVSGIIDRIEQIGGDGTDQFQVVDFKTGAVVPSVEAGKQNPQLALYQWLASEGIPVEFDCEGKATRVEQLEAGGAKLVYLAKESASVTTRKQCEHGINLAIGTNAWEGYLDRAIEVVSQSEFKAIPSSECDRCRLKEICPAFSERTLP